jgi:hypothetical protein
VVVVDGVCPGLAVAEKVGEVVLGWAVEVGDDDLVAHLEDLVYLDHVVLEALVGRHGRDAHILFGRYGEVETGKAG